MTYAEVHLPSDAIPVTELPPGGRGVIRALVEASPPVARRLSDLGFTPGTAVRVVRAAPLGDPLEFELRGTRLCLRASEARCVRVTPA